MINFTKFLWYIITRYQSESYARQTEISGLRTQLTDKERQIQWGAGELARVNNQLTLARGETSQKQVRINELTEQLTNLRIEEGKKEAKINSLEEELGKSQNIELRYKERKLDELVRNSGLNRERIDNLRFAYERLKQASDRTNFNQEEVM